VAAAAVVVMTAVMMADVAAGISMMKATARQRVLGGCEIVRLIHAAAGADQR